ncbi:hypothetical protein SAMN07250955_10148 [Arboricoccus pini]|uniref:Uncharacterized protein n=1 Tax=Arboricoccus pini TaxID=1963835 RepID=A0A212PW16_9PROT|nr:hypothetical protein SAMN07250955_10148 [Arboricoccus pini]
MAKSLAAGLSEGRLLEMTVFERDDAPAELAKQILEPLAQFVMHHGIQVLAIIVDDPPAALDLVLPALDQGLEESSNSASSAKATIRSFKPSRSQPRAPT